LPRFSKPWRNGTSSSSIYRKMKVRQEGGAVYARLEMDASVLFGTTNVNEFNRLQFGALEATLNWNTLIIKDIRLR
jgi:hypothetical protein